MNLRRILAVAVRERREVMRDRLFFGLAFIVPPVLLLTFGYGLSLDVENTPLAAVDRDRTFLSRDYLHGFIASGQFGFQGYLDREGEVYELLASGKARVVLIVPEHFEERLLAGRPVTVQALIDGTFPFRAQTTKAYVVGVNEAFSSHRLAEHLARTSGMAPGRARSLLEPIRTEVRCLYNPSLESDWSLVPRLMMMVLMICPPLLTAMGVVREKETGAIYNIYSSTITRGEYLLGKLAPYIGISILNIGVLWAIAVGVFGAPFKGGPVFFFLASVLYVICTTGMGLIVSVMVRTQVAAILITFIVTVVPSVFYSGIFVPIPSLGSGARMVAHLLPAMYYTDIVAGCFLKGIGLEVLWQEVLVLAAYATALSAIGYAMFRKRPAA
ncbi:MAG: ABC transporter permease [Syntrophobacteraceae bacterium]|jgi:ABC-2 type transport system permease protein/ribosome-dependent ATPase|nr:ABC transporter permease [Syntrophobacteraceae bacterium]